MIDNTEVNQVMEKLENLEDEQLAVSLLQEFNQATAEYGKLLMNQKAELDHDEWKVLCDQAKEKVDQVVAKINKL